MCSKESETASQDVVADTDGGMSGSMEESQYKKLSELRGVTYE